MRTRRGCASTPGPSAPENFFLPADHRTGADPRAHGRIADEIAIYLTTGIDGFFTDFADIGVAARNAARGKSK